MQELAAHSIPPSELSAALLDWFQQHHRDLPWRRTRDPYAIWVSEIMLQQTRVEATIPYYERFLARFPTVEALAKADEDEVICAWAGLGYYARARNLHRGAIAVMAEHGGIVPRNPAELQRLPGVGRYTAGAIASIAYNLPAPILDGNVIRVLCRLFGLRGDPARAPLSARLWALAEALIPEGRASLFNPAMMELGATVCTPARPACERCPVATWCRARDEGVQETLPEMSKAAPPEPVRMAAGILWDAVGVDPSPQPPPRSGEGEPNAPRSNAPLSASGRGVGGEGFTTLRVLLCRGLPTAPARPVGLAGMWQFPNGTLLPGETPSEGVQRILRELLGIEAVVGAAAASIKHTVTRYRVTLTAHLCAVKAVRGARCAVLGEDSAGRQAGAFTEHRAGGRPRGRRTDIDPSTAHGSAAALGCSQIAWVPLAALDEFGLPSAHRRVAEALIREEPQLELAFTG